MITVLTVRGPREVQTFRYFGIEGSNQALLLSVYFSNRGYDVELKEVHS